VTIYVKTKKGMDEMLARRASIDMALNSVLVLVDGKRSIDQLNDLIARAKAPADSLALLAYGGFIEAYVAKAPVAKVVTAQEQAFAQQQAHDEQLKKTAEQDLTTSTFLKAYSYMVAEAKKHLGLRGFGLQLKLERAQNMDELRTLITSMSDSIAKTQGLDMGNDFKRHCTEMLDVKQVRDASMRLAEQARAVQERRAQLRRVA
jgi:hypothetical protein